MRLFLKLLLSESGDVSTMRLMSIFSLLVGAGIACYGIYMGKDLDGVAKICAVFVGSAFIGKGAQKALEK